MQCVLREGLTTTCGDTACKRIALMIVGSLSTLPTIGMFIPLVQYYKEAGYGYGSLYGCFIYYGDLSDCHRIYKMTNGTETYSVHQMILVSLTLFVEICLVIITALHHCGGGCCGNSGAGQPAAG